ncbi:MAG: BamA/TamA family outer membrane protein [Cyclobacteriaceae bacterium]
MIKYLRVTSLLMLFLNIGIEVVHAQSKEIDSTRVRRFDIFPAISFSPETSLTLGALGSMYPNLKGEDPETRQSNINFLVIYTLANQLLVQSNWDLFTDGNKMRFLGEVGVAKFPNRNYGPGNNAAARVVEYELSGSQVVDSTIVNYKRYSVSSLFFKPSVLWEVRDHLYAGGIADLDYVWNFEELADSTITTDGKTGIDLLERTTLGWRAGLGASLIWDTRDNILSSMSGSYINLNTIFYGKHLGSEYDYYTILLDARTFLNTVGRHTLALRGVGNFGGTNDETIPLRGLPRIGGSKLGRGYFNGTFQDSNVISFQAEYRIPLWKENNLGSIYHFWKRLAMTAFASGAQAFGQEESFHTSNFNFGVGGGMRYLFNAQSRAYLRIDYAFGLTPNAGGIDEFQSGLYFSFGEAF